MKRLLLIPLVLFLACEDKQEKDCAGVEGGTAVLDECGVCNGDNSSCSGCTDNYAYNYDSLAVIDDGNCIVDSIISFSISAELFEENGNYILFDSDSACIDLRAEIDKTNYPYILDWYLPYVSVGMWDGINECGNLEGGTVYTINGFPYHSYVDENGMSRINNHCFIPYYNNIIPFQGNTITIECEFTSINNITFSDTISILIKDDNCYDNIDNDEDGLIDSLDLDCQLHFSENGMESTEQDEPVDEIEEPLCNCNDGIDNDNDGLIDSLDVYSCIIEFGGTGESILPSTPRPIECIDGIDNDNDGILDYDDFVCPEDSIESCMMDTTSICPFFQQQCEDYYNDNIQECENYYNDGYQYCQDYRENQIAYCNEVCYPDSSACNEALSNCIQVCHDAELGGGKTLDYEECVEDCQDTADACYDAVDEVSEECLSNCYLIVEENYQPCADSFENDYHACITDGGASYQNCNESFYQNCITQIEEICINTHCTCDSTANN